MKKRKSSAHQGSLDSWLPKKAETARQVAISHSEPELPGDYEQFEYSRTSKSLEFPVTRRNKMILRHLESSALTIDELSSLLDIRPQTILVELEFLRFYDLVRR